MKKLSRIDKQKIRDSYEDGLTQEELALIFGVSQGLVSKVVKRKQEKQDEIADRMERFLGGATIDDGCYSSGQAAPPTPEAYIDRNDPLSILLAEEEIKERKK